MDKLVNKLIFSGILIIVAGCYGGNALIAAGHGMLLAGMVLSFLRPLTGGAGLFQSKIELSAWFLLALLLIDLASILANLDSYDRPFSVAKKLRHLLLPLLVLFLPRIRKRIEAERAKLVRWAWLTLLGVASIVTVADMVNVWTGFHLFYPEQAPNREIVPGRIRLGGIFGMPMTYAYSMQFTVTVLAGVLYLAFSKKLTVFFCITLAAGIICGLGLYLSGVRGAVIGTALSGIVFLFIIRPWLSLAGVSVVALAIIFLSLQGNRWMLQKKEDDSLVTVYGLHNGKPQR